MTLYQQPQLSAQSFLVSEIVARSVATPDAPAIEANGTVLSYGALLEQATTVSAALSARGVTEGALVAVCLPRSIDQIVALLGAWLTGAGYLPLDPSWPVARLSAFVARAGCAALLVDPALERSLDAAMPEAAAPVPNLAYVIYTSGSSGEPKAVEVSHSNLAALVDWHNDAFAVTAGTRTSHLAGLGFDAAAWEVWPTLAAGGTLVLVDDAARHDPAALHAWLIRERIAVAFVPTALAEPMLKMDWPSDIALRVLLTGADKLTLRPAPGLPFALVNNYGLTETTVVATSAPVLPQGTDLPSIGRPIAGTQLYLLDARGAPVAAGAEGEIHVGGHQVALGYRGDAALTAERFWTHAEYGRLYRTGDLGAWLPDGELAFRGRIDAQVKIRGHRVEPAEIAAALNRLPAIANSVVVPWQGQLVAYIVAATTPDLAALRAQLAETLPDYMVPSRYVAMDALPLNPNGKVDAGQLPDPETHSLAETHAPTAPQTVTERRLLEIVCDVVGRNSVGVDDDFFLVGGHSLLGTQVVVRARDAFGVELTLFHLFEARTVARLAQTIETLVIAMLDGMSDEDIARMAE